MNEEFKEWEWVEVSDDWINWGKRIFIYNTRNTIICVNPYCVDDYQNWNNFLPTSHKYMRKIQPTLSGKKVTVEIDGNKYQATID